MTPPTDFRYPGEQAVLIGTIVVSLLLVVIFTPFTAGGLALVVLIGFVANWMATASIVARVKRSATPVERFPELARIVERCRERLGLRQALTVYVAPSPQINAYAVGILPPYTVVLNTGLLEVMDPEEQAFVVGHELGHVKFRHTTILALIGQLGSQTFGMRGFGFLIRLVFLSWMRVGEYSADRAGLVACGRLDKAISTQLKLALGLQEWRRLDIGAIVAHWRDHDVGAREQLGDALSTHPGLEARLDKIVDFAHSETYPLLRRG